MPPRGNVTLTWRGDEHKRRIIEAANHGLTQAAMVGADAAVRSFGRDHGGVPSQPGQPPHSQSGHLRSSIAFTPGRNLRAAFGTNVLYGRYLELGATPRAKRAKHLAIPLNRKARRLLVGAGGEVRNISGLRFVPSKRPGVGGFLVRQSGGRRGVRTEYLFVLKSSVRIRPRPWLKRAALLSRSQMRAAFVATVRHRLRAGGAA